MLSLLLRWSALMALGGPEQVLAVWIAAGALSRGAIALPLALLPAARTDGLGVRASSPPVWSIVVALVIAVGIAFALLQIGALPLVGVVLVAAVAVT